MHSKTKIFCLLFDLVVGRCRSCRDDDASKINSKFNRREFEKFGIFAEFVFVCLQMGFGILCDVCINYKPYQPTNEKEKKNSLTHPFRMLQDSLDPFFKLVKRCD